MNWLKQKIKDSLPLQKIIENQQFFRILAVAIAVNLGLAGIYVVLQDSVKDITVTVNGKTAQYKTIRNSVSKLLRGWEVELDEKDRVVPGADAELEDGMNVKIETYRVARETVEEETGFKTKKSYTSDLIEGETKVAKKGSKGLDKVVYEVAYLGDKEQSRKEIERTTVRKPVTEEILMGTAVSYNGVKYSRKLTVSSTAYCLRGRTATGTTVHKGTIAVDPRVIPLGSYGYVPGYGEVHAEDTGGAIKGNIIDVWFPTYSQCRSWGRRTVDIYIK